MSLVPALFDLLSTEMLVRHSHATDVALALQLALITASVALCSAGFIGREPMPPIKPMMPSQIPLSPDCVDKYALPLVLPPLMPSAWQKKDYDSHGSDNYEISVRKIDQAKVLPSKSSTCANYPANPVTTVFAYGAKKPDGTGTTHNWPGSTIEARAGRPVKVKWINELYDQSTGQYEKHLFADAIDQTLHWANPAGLGAANNCLRMRDATSPHHFKPPHSPGQPPLCTDFSPCGYCSMMKSNCQNDASCRAAAISPSYDGPVPIVTHLHGQRNAFDFADGYSEAWYMPATPNRLAGPAGQRFAQQGTWYNIFKTASNRESPSDPWTRGNAVFSYPNDQEPTQLWYHDHALGVTRLSVYAGLAGLYQIRDVDVRQGPEFTGLPWPPPGIKKDSDVRELPLLIQDRTFDTNGQLFYPVVDLDRNLVLPQGPVPPKWVPEFFPMMDDMSYATMTVNGRTYPYQNVVKETYRLRLLNGCNARTLILYFSPTIPDANDPAIPEDKRLPFWVIGNEAGFFPRAVQKTQLLLGPAERYDILFEFGAVAGTEVYLLNAGPNAPYDGMNDYTDGPLSLNQAQIMKFKIRGSGKGGVGKIDSTTLAALNNNLVRYQPPNYGIPSRTRQLALIERNDGTAGPDGPNVIAVLLGRGRPAAEGGTGIPEKWEDTVTTNPTISTVEDWEIINLTADAHPIHIHQVYFQVVKKTAITVDDSVLPPTWTTVGAPPFDPTVKAKDAILDVPCARGTCYVQKDTVLVPSKSIYTLRIMTPSRPGLFQWHCHLLEHEDNEMMRPWCVGQPGYINPKTGKNMCPGNRRP